MAEKNVTARDMIKLGYEQIEQKKGEKDVLTTIASTKVSNNK